MNVDALSRSGAGAAGSRRGRWGRHNGRDSRNGSGPAAGFGPTLRDVRTAHNLSQRGLAERVDLSASYLSLLESGHRRPTREQVVAIAHALALDPPEEQQLLASAGFAVDDVDAAIQRIVQVIAEQTPLDELDYSLVLSDLRSLVLGWRSTFLGARDLYRGNFTAAAEYYGTLAENRQYSPTLLTYVENRFADALLRTGELEKATHIAHQMRSRVEHDLPDDWAPDLKAEIMATQAMLALREGNYVTAHSLLEQSKKTYSSLLSGSPLGESLAYQGFGRSHKRLAQLALFEGDPGAALNACLAAEVYLARAPSSPTRDRWLRRTHELKGWAYSKLGTREDILRAIEIHTQTRKACEDAGDTYGAIMGWLYIADDLRRALHLAITEAASNIDVAPASTRRSLLHRALETAQNAEHIEQAEDAYQRALQGITQADDQLMIGRCLSSLAVVQRLRGSLVRTRAEAERIYEQAMRHLERALQIDRGIGQGRRLPSIYVAMADLAWDWADLDASQLYRAQALVADALSALNSPRISSTDHAAASLRQRLERARGVLAEQVRDLDASTSVVTGSPGPASITVRRWTEQCDAITERVLTHIKQHEISPCRGTDKDEAWLVKLLSIEMMPGPRLLAQNRLSVSLSLLLPGGSRADHADLYKRRYALLEHNVQAAEDHAAQCGEYLPNHDLCCRETIEQGLRDAATAEVTLEGLKRVQHLMRSERPGYKLDSTALPLQLAYMVKDRHVLIEVNLPSAARFDRHRASELLPGQALCYAIEDADLARDLTAAFERLLQLARESLEGQAPTSVWLAEQLKRTHEVSEPALAGSM